jgi:predicted transcriptional regulator
MRRSKLQIWGTILVKVAEAERSGVVRPTRIQSATNLPHDRFWGHVAELEARGLLRGAPLEITPKGRDLLRQLSEMHATLDRFGIAEETFVQFARQEGVEDVRFRLTLPRPVEAPLEHA